MADLGELTLRLPSAGGVQMKSLSSLPYLAPQAWVPEYPAETSSVSGTVTAEGSPVAGVRVFLLHRDTHQVVQMERTAVDGTYTFTHLSPTEDYLVLSEAPSETYNALVARPATD